MKPETRAILREVLAKLVDAVGETEAREIVDEVSRRMGGGGTARVWLENLYDVTSERYPDAASAVPLPPHRVVS